MKWILRTLGLAGTLLFAAFFTFTFAMPGWVEKVGKDFIAAEVQEQLDAHIEGIRIDRDGDVLAQAAVALYRVNEERLATYRTELKAGIHARLAEALIKVRNPECECRDRLASLIEAGMEHSISMLDATNERLTDFIQVKYLRVVDELKLDIRIFTATNAFAFLLLLIASFARPQALDHLVFPGVLLAVAVAVCTYCYVFGQNWLFAIIYSDYMGYAYLTFLGCVFGLLLDVFLNRGRVTRFIGNGLLSSVGSAFTLLPF
jgi:hypothetical protein